MEFTSFPWSHSLFLPQPQITCKWSEKVEWLAIFHHQLSLFKRAHGPAEDSVGTTCLVCEPISKLRGKEGKRERQMASWITAKIGEKGSSRKLACNTSRPAYGNEFAIPGRWTEIYSSRPELATCLRRKKKLEFLSWQEKHTWCPRLFHVFSFARHDSWIHRLKLAKNRRALEMKLKPKGIRDYCWLVKRYLWQMSCRTTE